MFSKLEDAPALPGTGGCGDGCGPLPSCAGLATPYVPFQQAGAKKYDHTEALENGTLFPGLNLPFHLKVDAAALPRTPLTELQALEFVLTELGLYLDTHPQDTEALELFRQYAAMEKEGKARYEALHGPVVQCDAGGKQYDWVKGPWPWAPMEGGKK